jgi:phosphatidylserine/phosphatidylglycerophosphate/cardiolipin synthase-like enzyme
MTTTTKTGFQVTGTNASAKFTLKCYRGEGMTLLAMNWKNDTPPSDFVGFAIEYKEPGGDTFYALKNRLSFPGIADNGNPNRLSTLLSPIQKFRWVHFPYNADLDGYFVYKVTPVFMNDEDKLSYGVPQDASIILKRETYPGQLDVSFTRGFVSSQAFVDYYESAGPISTLLPAKADEGLTFTPTHPKTKKALEWMGFEARCAILEVLDQAIANTASQVRVIAYDLNEPEIVTRLEKLGPRLKVIIDDDTTHGYPGSAENQAEEKLKISAGLNNVKRHHMGKLQHNKVIVVNGPGIKIAICGSTNFSWRGLYVQSNNAVIVKGENAIKPFLDAFDKYWEFNTPKDFGTTFSAQWTSLGIENLDAKISFSPHSTNNALLNSIASDINDNITSNLFFSLAFLYQTPGPILNAINKATNDEKLFVYGISDKKVGGIFLQKPNGNIEPVYPSALSKGLPEPFKSESTGGRGTRMHHKFVVIDYDKPSARVYLGSYNFSSAADLKNGENLLLIRDQRVAISYVIEALTMFDHYHFRVSIQEAKKAKTTLNLSKPPRTAGEAPWWSEYYTNNRKIHERELFS